MSIELITTVISSFAIFFIGTIVYFHDRRSSANSLFFLISLSTLFWAVANYFSVVSSPENILWWIRMVLFFAAPHAVLYLLFVINFPNRSIRIKRKYFIAIIVLLVLAMASAISPYVFSHITLDGNRAVPHPGVLMPFFMTMVLGSLVFGIIITIVKYFKARVDERVQWRSLLIGVLLSYFSLILTNFVAVVLFQNTFFIVYGPIFMMPTILGTAYAIVKHQLLNVKVISTEILVFLILSLGLVQVFIFTDITELVISIAVFISLFGFSIFLIRSVLEEVKRREEIQVLAEKLEVANKKLRQLDNAKTEFLSIASHQMRTPLSGIKGYLSMMIDGDFGKFTDEQQGVLTRVYKEVERLIRLVQVFLNVSRIESGRLEIDKIKGDARDLVDTVVKDLLPAATEKGLELEYKRPDKPLILRADFDKLKDVLVNLVDNAIKYTKLGSIEVKAYKSDGNICFEIKDTGVGIDPSEVNNLFTKFTRAKGIAQVDATGSGLGLFIAKKIVEGHQGRIWADSAGLGKGSVFKVELPIR